MILNTEIKVFMNFLAIWTERHISRANYAEITAGRPAQLAHEIFSIKRRFQRF